MANVTEEEKSTLERIIPVIEKLSDKSQEHILWICEGMTLTERLACNK